MKEWEKIVILIMLHRIPDILLPVILLLSALLAPVQWPVTHKVCIGASINYWVDSTMNPGSTYIWAINGIVIESSTKCAFVHTWNSEGTFWLTLQQVSAEGCTGELQTVQVIVTPTFAPGFEARIYPNLFYGPDIKFQLTLPVSSNITIDFFASNGQLIRRIFEGYLPGGESKTITYSHNLPQGIYLYQVRTENQMINGKIIIIRTY